MSYPIKCHKCDGELNMNHNMNLFCPKCFTQYKITRIEQIEDYSPLHEFTIKDKETEEQYKALWSIE